MDVHGLGSASKAVVVVAFQVGWMEDWTGGVNLMHCTSNVRSMLFDSCVTWPLTYQPLANVDIVVTNYCY